jgi:hypothetical protein
MLMSKIKVATAVMLAVAALSGAAGLIYAQKDPERTNHEPAQAGVAKPAAPVEGRYDRDVQKLLEDAKWVLTKVDGKKNTISVRCMDRMYLDDIPVSAKARVLIDGKAAKLTELKAGMCIDLTNLAAGQPTVTWIEAFTDNNQRDVFQLEAVDAEEKTIHVRNMLGGITATLSVAQNAKIVFRTVKGGRREGKLSDLKAKMRISLQMAADAGGIIVRGIEVELIDSAGEKVVVKP